MDYVRIDDKITRVMPDYTVCETVETTGREAFTTKSIPGVTSLRHEDENLTWVRGWHLPDSELVQAARAAQALDENKTRFAPTTGPYPPLSQLLPNPTPWYPYAPSGVGDLLTVTTIPFKPPGC